jgi:hypothetical protein
MMKLLKTKSQDCNLVREIISIVYTTSLYIFLYIEKVYKIYNIYNNVLKES